VPPGRKLGGRYKLDVDMPVGDFYPAILKYERAKQKIEPELNAVNKLLNSDVQEHIQDLKENNTDIVQVKAILKNTRQINVDTIHSFEDLEPQNLHIKKEQLEKDLKQVEEIYKKDLD